MSLMFSRRQSGDTIIEVILAISIFSLVAVAGLSVMNKGNASAQRSLEITLVRNQIDAQAEVLRFWNAAYVAAYVPGASIDSYGPPNLAATPPEPAKPAWNWAKLSDRAKSGGDLYTASAAGFGTIATATSCSDPTTGGKNVFIINPIDVSVQKLASTGVDPTFFQAETYSKARLDDTGAFLGSDGLWIEAVRSNNGTESQLGIGYIDFHISACWSSVGQTAPMKLGTVVRLYEPRQ